VYQIDVHSIETDLSDIKIHIIQGAESAITVTGDSNIIDTMTVSVSGNQVTISGSLCVIGAFAGRALGLLFGGN
jgi:hypothetical protein